MRPVENGSCVYVYVCVGMKMYVVLVLPSRPTLSIVVQYILLCRVCFLLLVTR